MTDLHVFLSYNEDTEGETAAALLRKALAEIHINAVMARHSIRPGADWERTIRTHLKNSAALVCVATAGFSTRPWCQQEIGWALGRHVPILWIRYGDAEAPTGFLASRQALIPEESEEPTVIARSVLRWLAEQPQIHASLADVLLSALERAKNYNEARSVAGLLAELTELTPDEWQRVEGAASSNNQVGDAVIWVRGSRRSDQPGVLEWLRKKLPVSAQEDEG